MVVGPGDYFPFSFGLAVTSFKDVIHVDLTKYFLCSTEFNMSLSALHFCTLFIRDFLLMEGDTQYSML
jgi:hypothetical protein